jgi:hypothetical protein
VALDLDHTRAVDGDLVLRGPGVVLDLLLRRAVHVELARLVGGDREHEGLVHPELDALAVGGERVALARHRERHRVPVGAGALCALGRVDVTVTVAAARGQAEDQGQGQRGKARETASGHKDSPSGVRV